MDGIVVEGGKPPAKPTPATRVGFVKRTDGKVIFVAVDTVVLGETVQAETSALIVY